MARTSRRGWLALAICLLILLAADLTHATWLTWLGSYLVEEQKPFPAGIAIVLGGDYRGTRVLHAAELTQHGFAPLVLVSGSGELYGYHESDLAVMWAASHGFPESLFLKFKFPATSTRDELQAVTGELRRRQIKRALLVTSTFHTRRAANIMHEVAPDIEFRMIPTPDPYFTPNGWWQNREGRKTFALEWAKTAANWFGL